MVRTTRIPQIGVLMILVHLYDYVSEVLIAKVTLNSETGSYFVYISVVYLLWDRRGQ